MGSLTMTTPTTFWPSDTVTRADSISTATAVCACVCVCVCVCVWCVRVCVWCVCGVCVWCVCGVCVCVCGGGSVEIKYTTYHREGGPIVGNLEPLH